MGQAFSGPLPVCRGGLWNPPRRSSSAFLFCRARSTARYVAGRRGVHVGAAGAAASERESATSTRASGDAASSNQLGVVSKAHVGWGSVTKFTTVSDVSGVHGINRPKQGFYMNTAAQLSPSSAFNWPIVITRQCTRTAGR